MIWWGNMRWAYNAWLREWKFQFEPNPNHKSHIKFKRKNKQKTLTVHLCDWLTRQQYNTKPSPLTQPVSLDSPQALIDVACSRLHDPHRHHLLAASWPSSMSPTRHLMAWSGRRVLPFPFSLSLTLFLSSSPVSLTFLSFSFFISFSLSFSSLFLWFFPFHNFTFQLTIFTQSHRPHTDSQTHFINYNYITVWVLYFSYLVLLCVLCWIFYIWIGFVVDNVTMFVNLIFVDFVICGWGLLVGSGLGLVY